MIDYKIYKRKFRVYKDGRVAVHSTGEFLKLQTQGKGNPYYGLWFDREEHHCITAARLVAEMWVAKDSFYQDKILYKDGDKTNIHCTNLYWEPLEQDKYWLKYTQKNLGNKSNNI